MLCISCTTLTTSFQTNAGKFLASTAQTVDAAMHGWAVWDATGKASPTDEATVRKVYQQYQLYMMVATNAYTLAVKTGDITIFNQPSNNLFSVKQDLVTATANPVVK